MNIHVICLCIIQPISHIQELTQLIYEMINCCILLSPSVKNSHDPLFECLVSYECGGAWRAADIVATPDRWL